MTPSTRRARRRRAIRRSVAAGGTLTLALTALAATSSSAAPAATTDNDFSPIVPVDEQVWTDQAEMTWDDYVGVRPAEWNAAATSQGTQVQYKTAVILVDFEDQPFLITQDPETHPFGNPQSGWEPVAQQDVNQWFYEYYAEPNEINGGQTLHSYWMEDTHGKIGVDVEVFGPYTLPGKLHEYGYSGFNSPRSTFCPEGDDCTKSIRGDGFAAWRADIGCDSRLCGFDNGFFVSAGHDESSTWEEFGQMLFADREDVPDELGPPRDENGDPPLDQNGDPMPNWANTRYVDWTSWRAAANHWPNAGGGTSTQAESSGQSVFAHEFSHLRGLPDNYNNPFADNIRNFTGYWEMMSRGTFNGPGGTHNRWQIPNAGGSALGPHHMLHFKQELEVLADDDQVLLDRSQLMTDGVAVATLKARSRVPNGDKIGLEVALDGDGYQSGNCETRVADDPGFWCPLFGSNWENFSMEVVDREGNDSFVPGHGVLIAQNRGPGFPDVWMIDANTEDIDRIDYFRPDGTPVPVVRGDPRQLDDATFHAGTGSGSEYEYLDEFNNLHLYVLDSYRDEDGVLTYDVAVRNTDGAGGYERGAGLADPVSYAVGDSTALLRAELTNTGEAGDGLFGSDVFRYSAEVDGAGWDVWLPYEVGAVAAGDTGNVAVYATAGDGASESATVTVTATSETDPSATSTIDLELTTADVKVTLDTATTLVDLYYDDGLLSTSERQQLNAYLGMIDRDRGDSAEDGWLLYRELASQVSDKLASAALLSSGDTLRE
ncbi:MAG TPA: immune inhibitor A domain-containing protein [Jiangellaceae bacterium]